MDIIFDAEFDEELKAKVARMTLSQESAQKLIAETVKKLLGQEEIKKLVKDAAETAIISTIRGYFVHGEGRRIVDAAVMKVVHESPLLVAIERASK